MSELDFANRLAKNVRHLRKWAKREGVTCYRLYDRDIPEEPVVLDWYEGRVVMADARRDGAAVEGWLDGRIEAARRVLELGEDALYVKRRARMATGQQYEKLGASGDRFEVGEGGHRFLVNLSDYLDTGLFLDHRITRARVGAEAAGKRVLNLFCYTASFTVYAAKGGAASSVSVDLSKTYLDWARDNLVLNGVDTRKHRLLHGDVKEVLGDLELGERFDLAVVDPPTWSTSKRMDGTFDVQRDHPAMLAAVSRVMAPGGVIWFSTNLRTFAFAPPARLAPQWEIRDETAATLPPDFRDRKIHQAFRIVIAGRDRA